MTGPAGNVDLPVAELAVDLLDQFDHLARLHFRRLGVERAVRLVAEVAASLILDTERGWKRLHLSHEVLRRQHLEVPRRTIFASTLALGVQRRLRDREHDGAEDSHCGES